MSAILGDLVNNALRGKTNKKRKGNSTPHNIYNNQVVSNRNIGINHCDDGIENPTPLEIDVNIITSITTICNSSQTATNDIVKQVIKYLKNKKLSSSNVSRCLNLINELFKLLNFRQTFCSNINYLKALMDIGQFHINNPSRTLLTIRHQLCQYFESWCIEHERVHPQLSNMKTYLEQKYGYHLSFHLSKTNQEYERLKLQKRNVILAQCSVQLMDKQVEVYRELEDIRTSLKSLQNLLSIVFPLHTAGMSVNNRATIERESNIQHYHNSITNDSTNNEQYEWEDSDCDYDVNDDHNSNINSDNDDDDEANNHSKNDDNYDDINWEEDNDDDGDEDDIDCNEDQQQAKRFKPSNNDNHNVGDYGARRRSNGAAVSLSSSSLVTQTGSAPYALEITFSTDPTDIITTDNEILLTQATEIALQLSKYTLPILMEWKSLLNQTLEYLVDSDNCVFIDVTSSNNSSSTSATATNNPINNHDNTTTATTPTITEFRFSYDVSKVNKLLSDINNLYNDIESSLNGSYKDLIIKK